MVDDGPAPIEAFAAPPGRVDLSELDPAATPIGPRSRSAARNAVTALSERLSGLQARLLAQGSSGNPRRVLLILQGMDTCGKDGVIKHVLGGLNPVGLRVMGTALREAADRTAELAAAGLPVLVLYGEHDDAWPPDIQAEMAGRLAARVAVIPGAAHSPAVENPAATAQALLDFWLSS